MISIETRDGVSIVRLDRSDGRNALVPDLLEALLGALGETASSSRPIVLTGTGRAFSPGADLKWLGTCPDPAVGIADLVAIFHQTIRTLLDMPVPVIAAVNGFTAGGGLGLALAPDYRLASVGATFTAAYFRVALTPDGGSSAFLQRIIGPARTMEMLLTNRTLDAHTALDWGLVNRVVPDTELMDRAVETAHSFIGVPALTLLETRRLLDITGIHNQLQLESVAIRAAAKQPEFRSAVRAFLDVHS